MQPTQAIKTTLDRMAVNPVNYWAGFATDMVVTIGLVAFAALSVDSWANALGAAVAFGLGLVAYSLYEYCFHRFLFHAQESVAVDGHRRHHQDGTALIGMPFFVASAIAMLTFGISSLLLGPTVAAVLTATMLGGYTVYGILHHLQHHTRIKWAWYLRLRKHHMVHHSFPEVNFGVTTTLWDRLLRTHFDQHRERLLAERAAASGK